MVITKNKFRIRFMTFDSKFNLEIPSNNCNEIKINQLIENKWQ